MEPFEDYNREYLQDREILEEERRMRMEAEWEEAEYEREKRLPATITIVTKIPKKEEKEVFNGRD